MAEHLDVLVSAEQIQARIAEMAREIEESTEGRPLLLVGVLKGSIHFMSDLGRAFQGDNLIDFMQVSSYHGGKSTTGVVQIRKDLDISIEGRDVVIIEDIVDTGVTLTHMRELLGTRKPKSLQVATLLSKRQAKNLEIPVEFVGFEISNEFVVGYGLDYDERYRNLSYIAILREE